MNQPSAQMSYAVGARRESDRDGLDYFPTPPWATRALCEWIGKKIDFWGLEVWEPACGMGHMSKTLGEYFGVASVTSSDIFPYGYGNVADFLTTSGIESDWIITNPPFNLAEKFALRALDNFDAKGVALLVRTSFMEGVGRHERLFSRFPPSHVLQFCERVPMHKGRLDPKGSTATSYCWVVWKRDGYEETIFEWLPPCRKRLERDSDYAETPK